MQVNSINCQCPPRKHSPNFGMAVKCDAVAFEKLPKLFKNADWIEFNRIVEKEKFNDVADILIHKDPEKLIVSVGSEEKSAKSASKLLKNLRNAMKRADKLKEQMDEVKVLVDKQASIDKLKAQTAIVNQ